MMAMPADRTDGEGERPPADRLMLDLGGWDGPLDVLLQLARDQKVDLAHLSILRLADQYLDFVQALDHRQIDLAAEYLVMAAWLAYLKSRLLLPAPEPEPGGEPTPAELAEALALRLRRLEAMRQAGHDLFAGLLRGRDQFGPGAAEGLVVLDRPAFDLGLYELLRVYADHLTRRSVTVLTVEAADLWSVETALARLEAMIGAGRLPDWSALEAYLPPLRGDRLKARSALAATFVAALELARQGRVRLRQDGAAYAPIYLAAGPGGSEPE